MNHSKSANLELVILGRTLHLFLSLFIMWLFSMIPLLSAIVLSTTMFVTLPFHLEETLSSRLNSGKAIWQPWYPFTLLDCRPTPPTLLSVVQRKWFLIMTLFYKITFCCSNELVSELVIGNGIYGWTWSPLHNFCQEQWKTWWIFAEEDNMSLYATSPIFSIVRNDPK